jgi:hypothetical protein
LNCYRQLLHEHQLPSDVYATLFPPATKSVRQHRRKKKIILLDIPYENFIGSILGGRFQLQRLRSQENHLDTYAVTNRCGQSFEAQAFSLSDSIPEKLLQARKRRMKRILLSRSFVCEIQQAGKRFLVSEVQRSDAEWKNLCQRSERQVPSLTKSKGFLTEEAFPGLATSSCRKGSVSSDSASQVVGDFQTPNLEEKMTLMDRRVETRCVLLARLAVSLRVLAVRAMRKLLRRDLSMIEVRRRLKASSSGKDASEREK